MTRVVHCKKEPYDVLIDRTTKWGNTFRLGRDGTREEVIEKFREKAWGDLEFIAMVVSELTGKTLACWCKPLPCHGDVYVEICEVFA